MAIHRHISTCADPSYLGKTKLVFWVIVTVVHSGVESSSASSQVKSAEIPLLSEDTLSIAYSRYKRSNEDRGMHSAKQITDLNNTVDHSNTSFSSSPFVNSGITSLKDNYNEKKSQKPNKLNKPYGVDKDSSKVAFETKHLLHNVTDEGKQRNVVQKSDKQNKKEDKLSVRINEGNSRSNTSNSTVLDTSYYKPLNDTNNESIGSEIIITNMTNTRVMPEKEETTQNNTIPLEMNDQPIEQTDDLTLNNTLSEDDCVDPSVTNCTEIGSNSTIHNGRTMPDTDGSKVLLISGVCLSSVVLLATAAGGGYVVYRRRLWNKPQTLSDKCSNADSSGYIDDSTLRENSEEMYSLDNDSFLNSLEAMTIQNYWTDNVKHTKL